MPNNDDDDDPGMETRISQLPTDYTSSCVRKLCIVYGQSGSVVTVSYWLRSVGFGSVLS